MSAWIGYLSCTGACAVVLVGDYFVKTAADRQLPLTSWQCLLGLVFYGASGVGFYFTLRHVSLAQMGVAFSALSLLSLCALGVIAFGETMGLREYLGVATAILSMILMARVV